MCTLLFIKGVGPVQFICTIILFFIPFIAVGQGAGNGKEEPPLVILTGGGGDALSYSVRHNVVAIALLTGEYTPHSGEAIAKAIKDNIFSGKQDVPLAIFIYPEQTPGKGDIGMVVYIRGNKFRDDYTEKNTFDAKALRNCAGQIVNKYKDPNRFIDQKNVLSKEWDWD